MANAPQERWVKKIKEMGVTPSVYDSYAITNDDFDVPCQALPGIRARFVIFGEGSKTGFEPGPYLIVGILPIGISQYPQIRDAIAGFALEKLMDVEDMQPIERNFGQGIDFEIVGSTRNEAAILKLKPPSLSFYRNLGQLVERGEYGIRFSPVDENKFPFS